jgi:hypothetical protein
MKINYGKGVKNMYVNFSEPEKNDYSYLLVHGFNVKDNRLFIKLGGMKNLEVNYSDSELAIAKFKEVERLIESKSTILMTELITILDCKDIKIMGQTI